MFVAFWIGYIIVNTQINQLIKLNKYLLSTRYVLVILIDAGCGEFQMSILFNNICEFIMLLRQ